MLAASYDERANDGLQPHSDVAKVFLRAGAHSGAKASASLRFCAAPHPALWQMPKPAQKSRADSSIRTMTTPYLALYSC
jgi:hypothetical protein